MIRQITRTGKELRNSIMSRLNLENQMRDSRKRRMGRRAKKYNRKIIIVSRRKRKSIGKERRLKDGEEKHKEEKDGKNVKGR